MKAALYVRVSTQEQVVEGYSIPAQINLLRNYANSYGYTIHKIYQDQGLSGKDIAGRPAVLELLEDAKKKRFDLVLIWKLSRLSRSLLDLLSIVNDLQKNSISLVSFSEHFDTSTPIGKMLLQLLGSIAEFERNTIVENVKMGMNERFKQGYSKGSIPFGYNHKNKKAVIVPEQAEIVRFAFEHYLKFPNKEGTTYIAEYLNSNGHRTRTGGLWTRVTIRDMLRNCFYAGYVRTGIHSHGYILDDNHAEIPGAHEPIISMEVYKKVQDKLNTNKKPVIRNPENDSIFTGLVICPNCGQLMYAQNTNNKRRNKDGELVLYPIRLYRCIGKDKQTCKGFYVSGKKIDPQALEMIMSNLNKSRLSKLLQKAKKQSKEDHKPAIDKVKLFEKEIQKQIILRDKYFKLFENDKVNGDIFADKISEILNKIAELEKEKEEELKNKVITLENLDLDSFIEKLQNFFAIYDLLTNSERKEWFRSFVKGVYISLDKNVTKVECINGIVFE